jgi:hypothetical protein
MHSKMVPVAEFRGKRNGKKTGPRREKIMTCLQPKQGHIGIQPKPPLASTHSQPTGQIGYCITVQSPSASNQKKEKAE